MKSRDELSLENAFVDPHPSLNVPFSDLLPVPSPTLDDSILFPAESNTCTSTLVHLSSTLMASRDASRYTFVFARAPSFVLPFVAACMSLSVRKSLFCVGSTTYSLLYVYRIPSVSSTILRVRTAVPVWYPLYLNVNLLFILIKPP